MEPLLDQDDAGIASVTADGAYDGMPTYDTVAARAGDIAVIIPPHITAVLSAAADHHPSQRDKHTTSMAAKGRLGWQEETEYGRRSLVETTMGRYKAIIGPSLRARTVCRANARRRPSAWRSSTACCTPVGQTPSAIQAWLPETVGEGKNFTKSISMQQHCAN